MALAIIIGMLPFAAISSQLNFNTRNTKESTTAAAWIMPACSGSMTTVAGFAWEDFNFNGIKDANETFGIQGLTVSIYAEDGTQVGASETTDIDGNWSIDVSASASPTFRVEYTNIPAWATETANGTNGNTLVQFVMAGDCANLGVGDPARYSAGTVMINTFTPCHVNGDPLAGGTSGSDDWFVGFPYATTGNTVPPPQKLNGAIIGATYGQTYSQQAQKIFAAAFLRRHSGLGTLGSGGIYLLEPTATSFNVTPFYNLDANGIRTRADAATAPAYGAGSSYQIDGTGEVVTYLGAVDPLSGEPAGLGVIGVNGAGGRNLPAGSDASNNDPAAFDQVGKVGLGDVETSDDGRFLFVTNLYSRSIVRLELDAADNPTAVVSTYSWNIADIPGAPTCTDGVLRPFALSFYRGKLYVGAVCTNEDATVSTAGNTNLSAHVFELNDPTGTGTFTTGAIVSQTLDFDKGRSRGSQVDGFQNNNWNIWTNDFGSAFGDYPIASVYPTPMITDIEFTDYGNMILAFSDRAGYQYGNANRGLVGTSAYSYQMGGHLLFAERLANGTYQVESDGQTPNFGVAAAIRSNGEGPGGGEFFSGAFFTTGDLNEFPPNPFANPSGGNGNHPSVAMGTAAVFPGTNEVFITAMDPIGLFSGGTMRLNSTTGAKIVNPAYSGYELYGGGGPATFGKAAGLGDIEISMERELPFEVGNYVWEDADNDGIQDPNESGIDGLTVTLWRDNGTGTFTQIATTTTVNGNYGFSSLASGSEPGIDYGVTQLQPGMNYELRFPTMSGALNISTMQNNGGIDSGEDLRDSDADAAGLIGFSTTTIGRSNLNFDVGYSNMIMPALVDYGDLPDDGTAGTATGDYSTLGTNDGPSHTIIAGLQIGPMIDSETDAQSSYQANGDDMNSADDEDGVSFPDVFYPGRTGATINVEITNANNTNATLYAFIDWDGDGDFDDLGETISAPANSTGQIMLDIDVPTGANILKPLGARFRLFDNTDGNIGQPTGLATVGGEVEDYLISVRPCPGGNCN